MVSVICNYKHKQGHQNVFETGAVSGRHLIRSIAPFGLRPVLGLGLDFGIGIGLGLGIKFE